METDSYFHPDEKFEYKDIPKKQIEEWAEKATRYDKFIRAYLKEFYNFNPTKKIELFSDIDYLILSLIAENFEYFSIISGPDGSDEVDWYYRELDE